MFTDYYKVFNLPKEATKDEIKKRYRELAKKYHPDLNKNEDATELMRGLLEAYYILNDDEARKRYDVIYDAYNRAFETDEKFSGRKSENIYEQSKASDFKVDDPILEKWILNARKQAVEFIKNTLNESKGITKNGCRYFFYALGINFMLFILVLVLIRTCSR